MQIAGQPFGEIWKKMPWQYKIVTAVGSLFGLFALLNLPVSLLRMTILPPAPEPAAIEIRGARGGRLDPSLAQGPETEKRVWMAYAAQEPRADDAPDARIFSVRLASAEKGACRNWSQVPGGIEGKNDVLLAPDGMTPLRGGAWRIETPSLIYDAGDTGREWKLYAYKYFWSSDRTRAATDSLSVVQRYGAIVYKSAPDPKGPWSAEQWLFAAAPGFPPPPYEASILLHLNRLDPQGLGDIIAYTRPSAAVQGGAIYMTLSAFRVGMVLDRIIMIVSRDHGNSWAYAGTVLRAADAPALGPFIGLSGATLVQKDGRLYLAVVPVMATAPQAGTILIPFADPDRAALRRDAKTGLPVAALQAGLPLPPAGRLGGGVAGYAPGCDPSGLVISQQRPNGRDYDIYLSRQEIPKQKD